QLWTSKRLFIRVCKGSSSTSVVGIAAVGRSEPPCRRRRPRPGGARSNNRPALARVLRDAEDEKVFALGCARSVQGRRRVAMPLDINAQKSGFRMQLAELRLVIDAKAIRRIWRLRHFFRRRG